MNQIQLSHPTPEQLTAFVAGGLDEAAAAEVANHLASCETCCQVLETLPSDPFLAVVRQAHAVATESSAPETLDIHPVGKAMNPAQESQSGSHDFELRPELANHPRYRLMELLGTGGMGAVYKAEHKMMKRTVALTVISRHLMDRPGMAERFRRESQAAARLSHPNIVAAHDAEEAGGIHFLVMEFVEGTTLSKLVADRGPLPVTEACEYVRQAAEGLQHACTRNMVHRDIKPSNLMITPSPRLRGEGRGEGLSAFGTVKILDFGLARFASELAPTSALTEVGSVMGTPDYMAPEQARDAHSADIRADIYSLGCTLYHLLSGRAPFPDGTAIQKVMSHIERSPEPITTLRPDVPGELAQVLDRMLAKDPAERYQTPSEVAQAIAPFAKSLEAEPAAVWHGQRAAMAVAPPAEPRPSPTRGVPHSPIPTPQAAPHPADSPSLPLPIALSSVKRWLPLAAAAVLLVVVGILFGPQIVRIATNKGQVVIETDDRNIEVIVKEGGATLLDRKGGRTITLAAGEHQLEVTVKLPGEDAITFRTDKFTLTRGGNEIVNVRLELAKLKVTTPPDGFTTTAAKSSSLDRLDRAAIPADQLFDWQPDELVAVLGDHRQRLWGDVVGVAFSPDGKLVACAGSDLYVRLFDTVTRRERYVLGPVHQGATALAFSPKAMTVACGKPTGAGEVAVRLWDLTGPEPKELPGLVSPRQSQVNSIAYSSDGTMLAFGGSDNTVYLWELTGSEPTMRAELKGHTDWVYSVAFAPNGKTLASASWDKTVRLWDLSRSDSPDSISLGHSDRVHMVAFSPDNKTLATSTEDGTLRLWEIAGKETKERFTLSGRGGDGLAFAPDSKTLATAPGQLIYLVNFEGSEIKESGPWRAANQEGAVRSLAIAPDGSLLVTGGGDGLVRTWEVSGTELRERQPFKPEGYFRRSIAFSPDGKILATSDWNNRVRLWNMAGSSPTEQAELAEGAFPKVFSRDGKKLFCSSPDGTVSLWDVADGKPTGRLAIKQPTARLQAVAISPDGKLLACGCDSDTNVRVWDLTASEPKVRNVLEGHTSGVLSLALAQDGRTLACGCNNGAILLWEISKDKPELKMEIKSLRGQVYSLSFTADGRTLAASSVGTVRLWDVSGPVAKEWAAQTELFNVVESIALSPDGKLLVLGDHLGHLIVADVATGKPQREWRLPGVIRGVAFAPDGRHIATANGNGTIYILRLDDEVASSTKLAKTSEAGKKDSASTGPKAATVPTPVAMTSTALVSRPMAIEGAQSWTIETRQHRGSVNSVAYSPNGRLLAGAGADGTIRLWDVATGRFVRCLVGHAEPVLAVSWAADGKKLASCARDQTVRIWDTESGKLLHMPEGLGDRGSAVAWSPDGKFVASAGVVIQLLDADSCKVVNNLEGHTAWVTALSWSPDGATLASASEDQTVRLWEARSGRLQHNLQGHSGRINALAWSSDGKKVASASTDTTLRVWDVQSGALVQTLANQSANNAGSVAWAPDGRNLAAGYGSELRLWDTESGQMTRKWGTDGGDTLTVVWSPDGKTLASGHNFESIWIWDMTSADPKPLHRIGPTTPVMHPWTALGWSPDYKSLAVGNSPGSMRLWDAETAQIRETLADPEMNWVEAVSWSRDGKTVAGSGNDKRIWLWDTDTGRYLRGLEAPEFPGRAYLLSWSPDGKTLAATSDADKKLWLWDVKSAKPRHTLAVSHLYGASWSPDSKTLAVSPYGGKTLQLFDIDSGQLRGTMDIGAAIRNAAWSPDGQTLAVTAAQLPVNLQLWDVRTSQVVRSFDTGHDAQWVAWSGDGKTLASGSRDRAKTVRLLDAASGQLRRNLSGGSAVIVYWSPDGTVLAYDGDYSTFWQWNAESGELQKTWMLLSETQSVAVTPDGHYRGTPEIEKELVYVVQTDNGQETLTPAEFAAKYGWANDPEQVRLTAP